MFRAKMWSLLFIIVLTAPISFCDVDSKSIINLTENKVNARQAKRATGDIPLLIIRPVEKRRKIYVHDHMKLGSGGVATTFTSYPEIHTNNGEIFSLEKMIPFLGLDSIMQNLKQQNFGFTPSLSFKPTSDVYPKKKEELHISITPMENGNSYEKYNFKPNYSFQPPHKVEQHHIPEDHHSYIKFEHPQQPQFSPEEHHYQQQQSNHFAASPITNTNPIKPNEEQPYETIHQISKPHVKSPLSISTNFYVPQAAKPEENPNKSQAQTQINYYFPKEENLYAEHSHNVAAVPTDYSEYFTPKHQEKPIKSYHSNIKQQQQKFKQPQQFIQKYFEVPQKQSNFPEHQAQTQQVKSENEFYEIPEPQPYTAHKAQQRATDIRPVVENAGEEEQQFQASKKQIVKVKKPPTNTEAPKVTTYKNRITPTTTTSPPTKVAQDRSDTVSDEAVTSTTKSPEQIQNACERRCIRNTVAQDYEPVCGSDGKTYSNKGKLRCAQTCGKDNLEVKSNGNCTRTEET